MFEIESAVIEWRGPAPFYFAKTPQNISAEIEASAGHLSYGWGCIPVDVTIGQTTFYTALIPREGTYFLPLKAAIRKSEAIEPSAKLKIKLTPRG
jgi:hypothetical protein